MAQRIRISSDLHLEAFHGRDVRLLRDEFLPADPRDGDAVLVLAGDISSHPDQLLDFLAVCLERFSNVVYVPGNHEYYKHHFHQWNSWAQRAFSELNQAGEHRLHFCTNGVQVAEIEGIRFILSTLWGDGGPTLEDRARTGFYLNDFRLIRTGDPGGFIRFTVPDMVAEFKQSKKRIEEVLHQPFDGKTVVVTHHLPSRRLVSARFWPGDGSDGANGGFVGDCDDLLAAEETAPALWVHGHTHDTIDTVLWKTRIVCNPLGYRSEWATSHNRYMESANDQRMVIPMFVEV